MSYPSMRVSRERILLLPPKGPLLHERHPRCFRRVLSSYLERNCTNVADTTIWFSAVALLVVYIFTTGTPLIYNLDLVPALLIIHIGILSTLMWFAFRADRRGT